MTYSVVTVMVIGIAHGMPELSFFSEKALKLGQVIRVSLGNRKVAALVSKIESAMTQKQGLKRIPYKLKFLEAETSKVILSSGFTDLATKLAQELHADISHILELVLPRFDILKAFGEYEIGAESKRETSRDLKVVCEPNQFFAEQRASTEPDVTTVVHPKLSAKEAVKRIKMIQGSSSGTAIVTPQYLSLLGLGAGEIVVGSAGENYRSMSTPAIDQRCYIEKYSQTVNAKLVYEDVLVPVDRALSNNSFSKRETRTQSSSPKVILVDTKLNSVAGSNALGGLSQTSLDLIAKALDESEKILIICARKGLAPLSMCRDCGTAVVCRICAASMVLRKMEGQNKYHCYKCGKQEAAERKCANCGSWNIRALGTGVEKVSTALSKIWPKAKQIVVSKDTQTSMASAAKVLEKKFVETSITMAVDSMVPYLNVTFDHTLVLGADTLSSLPSYSAREKLYRHLVMLRHATKKSLLIQSRTPDSALYRQFTEQKDAEFIEKELSERKRFGYPPYTVLIKISAGKGPPRTIKVPAEVWPNYKLDANLQILGDPKTIVEINPASIT